VEHKKYFFGGANRFSPKPPTKIDDMRGGDNDLFFPIPLLLIVDDSILPLTIDHLLTWLIEMNFSNLKDFTKTAK
jgi:hypothetical protein